MMPAVREHRATAKLGAAGYGRHGAAMMLAGKLAPEKTVGPAMIRVNVFLPRVAPLPSGVQRHNLTTANEM